MKDRNIHIGFLYANDGAVGRYRIINPGNLIDQRDNGMEVRFFKSQIDHRDVEWCDILVLQRLGDPWAMDLVNLVHQQGGKVVYEIDDYVDKVPEWNPAYKWLHKSSDRLMRIRELMRHCDLVTTTNEILKDWILGRHHPNAQPYNENVVILPNCQHMSMIDYYQKQGKNRWEKGDKVRFVWHGSRHHQGDLQIILEPLVYILGKYKNAEIVLLGSPPGEFLASLPMDQTYFLGEVLYDWFYKTLWMINGDIALCPLLDIQFNHGKSDIKVAESAVSGMVSIASDIVTFHEMVSSGTNGLLVENKNTKWIEAMVEMIEDADKRKFMQESMESKIRSEYNLDEKIVSWEETYRNLLT